MGHVGGRPPLSPGRARTAVGAISVTTLAVLAAAAAFHAPAAQAAQDGRASLVLAGPVRQGAPGSAAGDGVCFTTDGTDTGTAIPSDDYSDPGFEVYDSEGAADIRVGPRGCTIRSIDTIGSYGDGSGPADSMDVRIYRASTRHHRPGRLLVEQDDLAYTDAGPGGSLSPILDAPIPLSHGTFWITVVANVTFSTGSQWGWEASTDVVRNADQWRNPGGGFGVCEHWGDTASCAGVDVGDYLVTVRRRAAGS